MDQRFEIYQSTPYTVTVYYSVVRIAQISTFISKNSKIFHIFFCVNLSGIYLSGIYEWASVGRIMQLDAKCSWPHHAVGSMVQLAAQCSWQHEAVGSMDHAAWCSQPQRCSWQPSAIGHKVPLAASCSWQHAAVGRI